MEIIKKNITLIIGISIPILMILFVVGSIYLPGLFIQPKFNFLYASIDVNDYYYYFNRDQYSVQDEKLVKNEVRLLESQTYSIPKSKSNIKLYFYDVIKNESREISFKEAQNLNLDSTNISPDGFEVTYGSSDKGFFPFIFLSESDYNTRYLKGHNVSKKLNLQLNGSNNNFSFIGWIK